MGSDVISLHVSYAVAGQRISSVVVDDVVSRQAGVGAHGVALVGVALCGARGVSAGRGEAGAVQVPAQYAGERGGVLHLPRRRRSHAQRVATPVATCYIIVKNHGGAVEVLERARASGRLTDRLYLVQQNRGVPKRELSTDDTEP